MIPVFAVVGPMPASIITNTIMDHVARTINMDIVSFIDIHLCQEGQVRFTCVILAMLFMMDYMYDVLSIYWIFVVVRSYVLDTRQRHSYFFDMHLQGRKAVLFYYALVLGQPYMSQ